MTDSLGPKDPHEAIALFRAQVLGPVLSRGALARGELAAALRALSEERFRPPGADRSRRYGVSTLERWYHRYKKSGLEALRPRRRSDRGHARALDETLRELIVDIRREHPTATAEVILRTLVSEGRVERGAVSASTVRRLLMEHGLDGRQRRAALGRERRRWTAAAPDVVWHADVCHGPHIDPDGRRIPLRIHALLDDHSRYVVALQVAANERETVMLHLMLRAMRRHTAPEVLYLDNGATYEGDGLRTMCGRLGVALVHAKPHDPEARGKMERLWRTMREQCLDHLGPVQSLHDVQVRLLAWLDKHYHVAPHKGLMGRTPARVYEAHARKTVDEAALRDALVVRDRRRVRKDGTLSVGGTDFELDAHDLAGRVVTIARTLADPMATPWVEHEEQRLVLRPVDPIANASRPRQSAHRAARGLDTPFRPADALLRDYLGKRDDEEGER